MSREEIYEAIPHRPPMLLVDEIVSRDEQSIHCRKTFQEDEHFVQGHYPGNPIVPGIVLCEAGMQTGAILLSRLANPTEGQVPVATRLNDVKFKRIVRPGETIDIEVTLDQQLANAFFLKAKVSCEGKVAARFEFACALAEVPA
jgi:3-hydroxyacyl-[acyl-carrier-protein] dehydratase